VITCKQAEEYIAGFSEGGTEFDVHIASCAACRELLAVHRSLDELLTGAYPAPPIPANLREGVQARVKEERRSRWQSAAIALLAPGTGVAVSTACAYLAPELSSLLLTAGVALGTVTYIGQLLFLWLAEELGEG